MSDFLRTLHMLWSGEGLAGAFAWLPPAASVLLAVWLPRIFKLALLVLAVGIVYRMVRASSSGAGGRHLRGSRLVMVRFGWLRRQLALDRWRLRIGGVVFPRKLEPLHLLMTGGTGVGKSNAIQGTLDAIRGRGDGAVLADMGGEALSRFGYTGDKLLNPLDERSVPWSPFAEMGSAADAERMAKSMVPDRDDDMHREWYVYSQGLIAAVLKRLMERGDATNGALLHALTIATPSDLKALVGDLPAQALFHEGAERMLGSVRGIVASHLAPYSYLPKSAGAKSWSIRRHVREGKGWLWLSYREDQAAALRPLLATWIGEAVNALLTLPPNRKRRHWLMFDEVASLGRVQGLSDALTKGRKYGLCAMVGMHSVSQLREVYGEHGAQTLLSCLSSQLILRANDPETAEYASSYLGDREVMREAISHSPHGRTVSKQSHMERLVIASQIQKLPDGVGYLQLAGRPVVRRVKIPRIKHALNVEPFVPRKLIQEPPPLPAPSPPGPSSPPRPALDAEAILNQARGGS
jgi:hypothetical protein